MRTAAAWVVAALVSLLSSGCADPARPGPVSTFDPPSDGPSQESPTLSVPMDPASAELVAAMGPGEWALVSIDSPAVDEISLAARSRGFVVQVFDRASAMTIEGPVRPILDDLRRRPITSLTVSDPTEALRPISDRRPGADLPTPGRPYAVSGFATADLAAVAIPDPERSSILRSLAIAIQTIDGSPYPRLQLEGSCESTSGHLTCTANAVGFAVAAGQHEDSIGITATEATSFAAMIAPGSGWWTSVPRPIVRDAEWIARHDEAALERIRMYATIAWASWDPDRPGRITLAYQRPCRASVAPTGAALADTGESFDVLSVQVDLRSASVAGITERSGP